MKTITITKEEYDDLTRESENQEMIERESKGWRDIEEAELRKERIRNKLEYILRVLKT